MTRAELFERDSVRLERVHPEVRSRVKRVLMAMDALGFPMTVTDTLRTLEEQQRLYAQGRTAPGDIVTHADGVITKSNHQSGRAVDCTFLDARLQPTWNESLPWTAYGENAKAVGLKWGGDFKSKSTGRPRPDKPHVELP